MLVSDFKEKQGSFYPEQFLNSLPDTCLDGRCRFPMEMTETITNLHCSNPRCPTKVARRMTSIANALGIKDFGVSRANAFISKFGIGSPLAVFMYEYDIDGTLGESISADVSQRIQSQFNEKNKFTLWEYVRIANLPYIQTSALAIFGDYDDLNKAYADIEAGGVEFIRNKLNIGKATNSSKDNTDEEPMDISIRALKIYDSLMTFKNDLFQCLDFVDIIETHREDMISLTAVCSDEVGAPFRTKADFYTAVNNMFDNIHIDFTNSVNKSIDYLIWAGADEDNDVRVTNKVLKTRKYNEQYNQHKADGTLKPEEHYIKIMTAGDFIEELKNLNNK